MIRLLWIAVALALPANALAGTLVPFKEKHFLDARFIRSDTYRDDDVPITITFTAVGSTHDQYWTASNWRETPYAYIALHGKYWTILNEFVANPSFTWAFKDRFYVRDSAGNAWKLDREELAGFPPLLRRFQRATFSFQRAELAIEATTKRGAQWVTITMPGVDFIIPSEGAKPIMAPSSPLKWSEMVKFDTRYMLDKSEKNLPKWWKELTAVKSAQLRLVGLQVPTAELVSIAKELEQRKKKLKELDETYASVKDDYAPKVKPFQGSGDEAQPYEPPRAEAFADRDAKLVGLKDHGRVLVSWPSDRYRQPTPVGKGRYFVLEESGAKGKVEVVNRRGEAQRVEGMSAFDRVDRDGGKVLLVKFGREGYSTEDSGGCNSFSKFYEYESDALGAVRRSREAEERRVAKALEGAREGGVVLGCMRSKYKAVEVTKYEIDDALKVVGTKHGYELRWVGAAD